AGSCISWTSRSSLATSAAPQGRSHGRISPGSGRPRRSRTSTHACCGRIMLVAELSERLRRRADARALPPVRVLFLYDHLGYPGGITHGLTCYCLSVLPRLDPGTVQDRKSVVRE